MALHHNPSCSIDRILNQEGQAKKQAESKKRKSERERERDAALHLFKSPHSTGGQLVRCRPGHARSAQQAVPASFQHASQP